MSVQHTDPHVRLRSLADAASRVPSRPSREEALQAVRTLLLHIGENPDREGLVDTPARFLKAWGDLFSGYDADPGESLGRTFEEVEGYDDIVLLQGVEFFSHCEHHVIPIRGTADIAYLPDRRVVGISKLARVVDAFARRLQTQEALTAQIADTIDGVLRPRGVAVTVRARHMCMEMRGVRQGGASTVTTALRGAFRTDEALQGRLDRMLRD
ncbi:MAG: GTP cyclohydrolase I FolE [Planctomycetota bacterium]